MNFGGGRFVLGRSATDCGRDPGVEQPPQAVLNAARNGAAGETGAVQAREEEIPRAVAGEVAAGAVRAVGGGGEAQYDDARVWVAKAGDGAASVGLVFVGGAFLAPLDQAWAKAARDYFGLQGG